MSNFSWAGGSAGTGVTVAHCARNRLMVFTIRKMIKAMIRNYKINDIALDGKVTKFR